MQKSESEDQPDSEIEGNEFVVWVDDNFHYQDEDERWCAGRFSTDEAALAKAIQIVGDSLQENRRAGISASELYAAYCSFGDDPWISATPDGIEKFSAWTYAKQKSGEITSNG